MKRLLLKRLIVISDVEKSSREINLHKGLNLIIGENKTGKSSLIKSIFYSLGCELPFEDDWKNLVQKYILYFQYGETEYCVIRENKKMKLFTIVNESESNVLVETEHFHEFCLVLMQEFNIVMDCLTRDGKEVSVTTPLLFRFQYIDQDAGWSKIGESFKNMKYIRDWDGNTNKYVVGYQGEEYYKEKRNLLKIKNEIQEYNVKVKYFNELLKAIQTRADSEVICPDNVVLDNAQIKEIFSELDNLERRKLRIDDETNRLKNIQYERNLHLVTLKKHIKELDKDHEYALKQEEEIICPTCGTVHSNTLFERLDIVKDIQSGSELIKQIREELKEVEATINDLSVEKSNIIKRYNLFKKEVERNEESASIATTYRNEGKQELVSTGKVERDKILRSILDEELNAKLIEDTIKELKSTKSRNKILTDFKAIYEKILSELNIPLKTLKLHDFVQKLTKTGSETPRIIYAYHVALYLYNLDRIVSPFNFLVIDTPNQQGQDGKNLKSIDEVLEHLLDKRGQVIIGTERETGYEEQASEVIRLVEERKTLTKADYKSHIELFTTLEQLAVKVT